MIHQNSKLSYEVGGQKIHSLTWAVYSFIKNNPPMTDKEIAAQMGFSHRSKIQPRISDLFRKNLIKEAGNVIDPETNRLCRKVEVV